MEHDPLDPYPYSDDFISVRKAVSYISAVVYPNLDLDKAKLRVRDRINKAVEKGHLRILRRPSNNKILAIELFTWAGQQKHWGILYQVPGLPIRPNSGSADVSLCGMSGDASGTQIPAELPELERQTIDFHIKLAQLQRAHEQLQQEHLAVVKEVEEWRKKDALLRKKRSDSAKRSRST